MDNETITILQSSFVLVPLILFAILVLLYVLVKRWQSQTSADFKTLRSELRQLNFNLQEITKAIQDHSPDDPEPYGSRLRQLHDRIQVINENLKQLETRQVTLQEKTRRLNQNGFRSLAGGPYFWYRLRSEIKDFQGQIQQTWQSIQTSLEQVQQLDQLGWEIAQKARQVNQLLQRTGQVMDQLRAHGMRGKTIANATLQEKEAGSSLLKIPLYFLEGDEKTVHEQADKALTISTYNRLETIQQNMQALLTQATRWEEQYLLACEQVSIMQTSLTNAGQTLTLVPGEVDIEQWRILFNQLTAAGKTLSEQLAHIEVDQLEATTHQAIRVANDAQATQAELSRICENVTRLKNELAELTSGLKEITMIITSLGARSLNPVAWRQSSDRLADINRQNNAIGPATKARDVALVVKDIEQAAQLNKQQQELSRHLSQLEAQHVELTQIVTSPEISQITPWLNEVRQIAEKVKDYAPENWPRGDAVAELSAEVQSISNDVLRVMPPGNAPVIPEMELSDRLEDARRLQQAHQNLQKRIENIRNQLTNLQKDEKLYQDQLTNAQATLNQMAYIVRSNPLLSQVASQEITHFQQDLQNRLDELSNRQSGTLDKKIKIGQSLLVKIEQSTNHWLDQMKQDTQQQVQGLTKLLKAVEEIAPLEEQPIHDARRLLTSNLALGDGYTISGGSLTGKSKLRLEELTPEFKRRSDFWQACSGTRQGLEAIAQPLLDTYQQADQQRQQAHEMLTQVATWLRQIHDWPPNSVALDESRQETDHLDGQWHAIKSSPARALQLVQGMGQLAARYQELAIKIQHTSEQAEREMSAVEELENAIIDLAQNWQNNWRNYQDDPQVAQDIRNLLDQIEHELSGIKRRYKQKRNYSQVYQSMKALERKARAYQVELDQNRALDVEGNEHRRR